MLCHPADPPQANAQEEPGTCSEQEVSHHPAKVAFGPPTYMLFCFQNSLSGCLSKETCLGSQYCPSKLPKKVLKSVFHQTVYKGAAEARMSLVFDFVHYVFKMPLSTLSSLTKNPEIHVKNNEKHVHV